MVEAEGENFGRNPLGAGAGAYEFESISDTPGESLVLVAKDDWWGGPVCIQRIEFTNVQVPSAAVDSFVNGEADTIYLSNSRTLEPVREAGLLEFLPARRGLPVGDGRPGQRQPRHPLRRRPHP